MRIVTVSREFGSGGRELGKRLADYLGFQYYDKEILTALASQSGLQEDYLVRTLQNGALQRYHITYGRSFSSAGALQYQRTKTQLLLRQQQILKEFARQGDCVVVGRSADVVLSAYKPCSLFVYADLESKIARCRRYAGEKENLSQKDLEKKIRQIDQARSYYYALQAGGNWGAKENYHLCVNITGISIKEMVPLLGEYIRAWFGREEQ